ncbi:MAG: hypothetical protein ACD_42C00499G0003 [uncultured bacterium]|nr:MAG: hypothetical protein ACD_42C00499G0003 [uncultured bacterium]OGT34621.1 MAG: phosphoglycerate mutase (2,3-diphosphoglycerate-independent) [Gammaproteobacteria bacterium RIFCSPHIGHO2_02_FULL_39_13]OGT50042.1 MAG: phosphoglycerate mutase (2,3-diphosphoglycerate-independent) [Gammaproteobacteria bacterium RIFCSPHIGHO2_12_FULL_39_24]
MKKKPFALIILDGWGYRQEITHNPTRAVSTPTFDYLFSHYPHCLIEASGEAVGLPAGQMGNSEVGHLHIGAGRKVPQDLTRIHQAIKTGSFFENVVLKNSIQHAKKNNSAVHILGLASDGGVHSHIDHLCAMIDMVSTAHVKNYCHVICDGRDTPPQSALPFIRRIDALYQKNKSGKIASVIGRYFAMDRDNRLDRTKKAYDLFTAGQADYTADSAEMAVKNAYARNETDEFISPTCIMDHHKRIVIEDNDVVIMINFRADRARQLTHAFINSDLHLADFVTFTDYVDDPSIHVAHEPLILKNTLGELISEHGLTQLRLAETEKYAHVTYFLNGGVETPTKNEDRTLIPSPTVATYDTQPEMSADALTDAFVSAIENQQYDLIVCNYANPDMIGHTGNEKAAEKAVVVIDACLQRVLTALKKVKGEALITADHGNIELMYDEKIGQPHTAHTTNLVPLIYVGRPAKIIITTGALDDVAPTLLYLMGLSKPTEMTGKVLVSVDARAEQKS